MIGIFDSGVGGLSVLRRLKERAPYADVVYFGDTLHAPYGPRKPKDIAHLISGALRRFYVRGVTDIISACNSASVSVLSVQIDLLRLGIFNVIEMVGPTVGALKLSKKRIAILGTQATIDSGIYEDAFDEVGCSILSVSIPSLAGLIEIGVDDKVIRTVISGPIQKALTAGAEVISLNCTHYPFVSHVFNEVIDGKAELFDPADAVAEEAVERFGTAGSGKLEFILSKESDVFRSYLGQLFEAGSYTVMVEPSLYQSLRSLELGRLVE